VPAVLIEARIVYETAKISIPTMLEGALGSLGRDAVDRRLRSWGQACLDAAAMTLDVRGRDAVDWSRAYVVMSNHQSLFDIPVIAVTVPGSLRFVAKKELFRVPIWGRAMRAAEIIRSGINIWIAPEGTRSITGAIGPLKKGGFMLALDTATPILPMAISGTRLARKKHGRTIQKGVRVDVRFGQPISVEGRDRDQLMAEVDAFLRANAR
jgi:1-acyl-sn-glycerol-3-phosphate acyltransferase